MDDAMMKKCPACQTDNPADAEKCKQCQADMPDDVADDMSEMPEDKKDDSMDGESMPS